jgi:arylformamidase
MKIYDISMLIKEDMVVWKEDPKPLFKNISSIKKGDTCNLTEISLSTHTGTHIDAPSHFLKDGMTIDQINPNLFFGEVSVIEIFNKKIIEPEDLQLKSFGKKVLLKTDNSKLLNISDDFFPDYSAISASAAEYLVSQQTTLVGIDYLSIGLTGNDSHITHQILLSNNILIVEGLNLSEVPEGNYQIYCAPLKLKSLDGSPARVFLIEE